MKLAEELQSASKALRELVDAARAAGKVVMPGATTIRVYEPHQTMDTAPKLLLTMGEVSSVLVDGEHLQQFESIDDAAREATNYLRYGCLCWSGVGVFLTTEQMKTFSAEWQGLFRELGARGWRVTLEDGAIYARKQVHQIRAVLARKRWYLQWTEKNKPQMTSSVGTCEVAIHHFRGWAGLADQLQGGAAS